MVQGAFYGQHAGDEVAFFGDVPLDPVVERGGVSEIYPSVERVCGLCGGGLSGEEGGGEGQAEDAESRSHEGLLGELRMVEIIPDLPMKTQVLRSTWR